MWKEIGSAAALAHRLLDMLERARRWWFITEKTEAYQKADAKASQGDGSELEEKFRNPNRK